MKTNITRPHVVLWILYMIIYTFLLVLIPCTWISFIWDQIIDPEFDLEHIEQPENRLIKAFYQASGKINTSFLFRNLIFIFIGIMIMFSSVLDLIITPCMLENPRVKNDFNYCSLTSDILFFQNYTYRCALAIMVFFTFLRIPNIFKVFMCLMSLTFYGLIIFGSLGKQTGFENPKTFFSVSKTFSIQYQSTFFSVKASVMKSGQTTLLTDISHTSFSYADLFFTSYSWTDKPNIFICWTTNGSGN